jgi:hypothetical protein
MTITQDLTFELHEHQVKIHCVYESDGDATPLWRVEWGQFVIGEVRQGDDRLWYATSTNGVEHSAYTLENAVESLVFETVNQEAA